MPALGQVLMYTPQDTYLCAYYVEAGLRKKLNTSRFSWRLRSKTCHKKVKHVDNYDQMHIREQWRRTLLKDFCDT